MKFKKIIITLFLGVLALTSCGNSSKSNRSLTITWKNYDGTILEVDENVKKGTLPSFDSKNPSREPLYEYRYTFDGWLPEVKEVTKNTTFIAQYKKTTASFTITWKNYDGTILEVDKDVPFNTVPEYHSITPTRPSVGQYSYEFNGWNTTIAPATKDVTYVACYRSVKNIYNITWKNYDGTILDKTQVEYGFQPIYNGEVLTKSGDDMYSFVFDGWEPEVVPAKADATYTAKFKKVVTSYTVTWKNSDGSILEVDKNVPYGSIPSYKSNTPVIPSTDQYDFVFNGWYPNIHKITSDITFTARYGNKLRHYKITWQDYDGTVLEIDNDVPYGSLPIFNSDTPKREPDMVYNYTFQNWSPKVVKVSGDQTYTACYSNNIQKYTVIWKNYDGTILKKEENVPYGSSLVYDGERPIKKFNNSINYAFTGWDYQTEYIFGDIITTATFDGIALGEYPQTQVSNPDTILELNKIVKNNPLTNPADWNNYENYYVNSTNDNQNYRWYKDIEFNSKKYRAVFFTEYPQWISGFSSHEVYYFEFEPLRFDFINDSNVVLTHNIIDSAQCFDYHPDPYFVSQNYVESDIRKWLNSNFLNEAFKENDKNSIAITNVDNSGDSFCKPGHDYFENTNDQIFLLSYKENRDFVCQDSRLWNTRPTDYARCMGMSCDYSDYTSWLRSPYGQGTVYITRHNYTGNAAGASDAFHGIRPALTIKN